MDDDEQLEPEPIDEMTMAKDARIDLEIELGRPVSWEEFRKHLTGEERLAAKTENG